MCPTLLDKFKEKNTIVCSNAAESLTAMHRHCFALADVAEDFSGALVHKNPKVGLHPTLGCFNGSNIHAHASAVNACVAELMCGVAQRSSCCDVCVQ